MPPRWHESACLAAQAAHHHHRGQCQPRSAPASLSFSRHHLSLSLSLSLSFAADRSSSTCALAHYRLRPCRGRWLRRPLCPRGCGLGGEISTEISLKSRPNVGGLQEGFFFVDHGASQSARSAPTSISPPLPPPPPPSERGCPRREEPPAGAGSRRPNSATVASTDGVLLLLESRLGAF